MSSKLLSYTLEDIPNLKYKQLQALCKSHHIKANSKSAVLVQELQSKWLSLSGNNKENDSSTDNIPSSAKKAKRKSTRRRRKSFKSPRNSSPTPSHEPKNKDTDTTQPEMSTEDAIHSSTDDVPSTPLQERDVPPPFESVPLNDTPMTTNSKAKAPESPSFFNEFNQPEMQTVDSKPSVTGFAEMISNKNNHNSSSNQEENVMVDTDCSMEDHSTHIISDGKFINDDIPKDLEFPMECPSPNIAVDLSSPEVPQRMICDLESNDGDTSNINNGSFVDVDTPLREQPRESPQAASRCRRTMLISKEQSLEDQLAQLRDGEDAADINMSILSNFSKEEVHNGSMVAINECTENEDMQMDDEEEEMEMRNVVGSPLSKIVSNDVDAANQNDIEISQHNEQRPREDHESVDIIKEMMQQEKDQESEGSSLSMDVTPKLNKSMEKFIRDSLRPETRIQKRVLDLSPAIKSSQDKQEQSTSTNTVSNNEDASFLGLDKPISPIQQSTTQNKENMKVIDQPPIRSVEEREESNTSLLAMSASRILVDDDDDNADDEEEEDQDEEEEEEDDDQIMDGDEDEDRDHDKEQDEDEAMDHMNGVNENETEDPKKEEVASQQEKDESSPDWKQTPMKALEILHSVSRSMSSEPSQTMHKKVLDFDAVDLQNDNEPQDGADQSTQNLGNLKEEQEEEPQQQQQETEADQEREDEDGDEEMKASAVEINDVVETEVDVAEEKEDEKSDTVENLFWEKPESKETTDTVIVPKEEYSEEPSVEKREDSISMTFGDGQKFAFKSIYSPSIKSMSTSFCGVSSSVPAVGDRNGNDGDGDGTNSSKPEQEAKVKVLRSKNRRKRPRSRSMTPEDVEKLCDKTTMIRQMFEEEERRYDAKTNPTRKKRKCNTVTPSKKKRPAGTVPDWNKIHNEQIFSRQTDLADWDRERKARTNRLFGTSINSSKMSTPGLRPRSRSMIGGRKPTHSAKAEKSKKRINTIIPSSNDHRFNHGTDSKLQRKTSRDGTPYKHNESRLKGPRSMNKKASMKPSFGITFTENSSVPEEKKEEKKSAPSPAKTSKVPKGKLAFNPDNVRSRLFESTSSSTSKMRKTAITPQIKSTKEGVNNKKDVRRSPANKSAAKRKRDWSAVKSRVDTGRMKKVDETKSQKQVTSERKLCPLKRRLSWSSSKSAKESGSKNEEPATKKRRISAHPGTARRWQ